MEFALFYLFCRLLEPTKTRKAPGALHPAVVLPPTGGVKYVMVTQDKSPRLCSERRRVFVWPSEKRRSGASDHPPPKKKSPRGIRPRRCSYPPGGCKICTVTQDKSPCLCSERHEEYLFGQAKSGGLGQVTTKKKKRKAPGALDPAVVLPLSPEQRRGKKQEKPQRALTPPLFSLPLESKIYYGQVKVGDLSYFLRVCADNINQDMTCLITLF